MGGGRSEAAAEEVADRLHSAAIHLLRRVRRVDDASGLSPARLSALSVLVFGGASTVGRLAAAEQVRSPTMTRLVQELEAEGLVRRIPSASDRRVVQVRATPKGKRLLLAARRRRVASLRGLLAGLEPEQLAVLDGATSLLEDLLRWHHEAPLEPEGSSESTDV
jgi:DNA-binding MarR family transcriptional regulator